MHSLKKKQRINNFGNNKPTKSFHQGSKTVDNQMNSETNKQKRRIKQKLFKTEQLNSHTEFANERKNDKSSNERVGGRYVLLNPDVNSNESPQGGHKRRKRPRKRKAQELKEIVTESEVPSKKTKMDKPGSGYNPEMLSRLLNKTQDDQQSSNNVSSWKKQKKRKAINSLEDIKRNAELLNGRMKETLAAAKFRYINEKMYTTTSQEALDSFKQDPDTFKVYHSGYQQQLAKWPVQPIDIFIKQLNNKAKKLVVADMGCGDPRLARSIHQKVYSFDLLPLDDTVIQCDMSKVPLEDGTVDVVVFCLSLMGTNLTDFIMEARRILKHGGSMKIAEVESRFEGIGRFIRNVELLGFTLVSKDQSNKMFFLFEFKKSGSVKKKNARITLAPCLYKKR